MFHLFDFSLVQCYKLQITPSLCTYLVCVTVGLSDSRVVCVTVVGLFTGILAVGVINDAVDQGNSTSTLDSLQLPTAKLSNVRADNALHYQALLSRCKKEKAKVSWDSH